MTRKKASRPATVSTATGKKKTSPAPRAGEPSVYGQLAQRTIDLWRDHLNVVARSPAALHEMNKALLPAFSLFTQGLDMWLTMADPWNTTGASKTSSRHDTGSQTKKSGRAAKRSTPRAAATGPGSVPGYAAMAELARRVADMERERGTARPAGHGSRTSASKTASVIGFEEAVGHRLQRRRKA